MLKIPSKAIRLKPFEEIVGELHELANTDGLTARIGNVSVILPREMEPELRPFIGSRIGILRTDIPKKEFLFRVLAGQKVAPMTAAQDLCEDEQISNCSEVI
ncbi:MAG: hypothetical protein MUO26_11455 [Methanotrichaceae archaeon]|nr:hypothetical protein [Methanotrichaceae archaeon]